MADFSIPNLGTAVAGFTTTTSFLATQTSFTIDIPAPTAGNRDISFTETRPGFLTGRRPSQGQVFPRGVYSR